MNFEDIVDMEWVDSHTTHIQNESFNDSLTSCHEGLIPDTDENKSVTTLSLPSSVESAQQPTTMPSMEQIKELIELAKLHLLLREQQQQLLTSQDIHTTAPLPPLPLPDAAAEAQPSTVAPEELFKPSQDTTSGIESTSFESLAQSAMEDAISLEDYAQSGGINIKDLTPKERRQLRNKISARNFRVRRKEYINTLEAKVNEHKRAADLLQQQLGKVEDENKQLRQEVDTLRRQNQLLMQKQSGQVTPASPSMSVRPTLNKDLSVLGTGTKDSYRQENCIMVSSTTVPDWNLNDIFSMQMTPVTLDKDFTSVASTFLLWCLSFYQATSVVSKPKTSVPFPVTHEKSSCVENLYDAVIMASLANLEADADKRSFWWWEPTRVATTAV